MVYVLSGTGILFAVSAGWCWLIGPAALDLYIHDWYVVVAPLHLLFISALFLLTAFAISKRKKSS